MCAFSKTLLFKEIALTKNSEENQIENSTENQEDNGEKLENTDNQNIGSNIYDEDTIPFENILSPKTISSDELVIEHLDRGS